MAEEVEWFVGIDWASQSHQVCLVDAHGECVAERAVAHGGLGIEELCDWLIARTGATPEVIGVAIKMTQGQRGAQYRRLDRYLSDLQRAVAPRAVPSEHARRPGAAVERAISGHTAPHDQLFHRSGHLAGRGADADDCLGRAAGADAGVVPRLHGRLLGVDAAGAGGGSARADVAQGQAGGGGAPAGH
jgi:Transposase